MAFFVLATTGLKARKLFSQSPSCPLHVRVALQTPDPFSCLAERVCLDCSKQTRYYVAFSQVKSLTQKEKQSKVVKAFYLDR